MSLPNRRAFLQTTAAAAVAGAGSRILGANDRVNVAVVGLGGRGRAHMQEWSKVPNSQIVALCDIDQAALERGTALVQKLSGNSPAGYSDMRKLFEDKNVDAVSMPLPNHWHALATIWACQAGKDVYIEKPASHNVWEGQKMIEAARKYKRMVQIGSQSRSIPHKMKGIELLKQGIIGKVYMVKADCYKRRPSIGHKPDSPVPPGVDWDLFLGPAPMRPFNELRFKYNWHWFWDTGNGDIGNQGVHQMDIAAWGLGLGMPLSVSSTGGKFVYDDDQETPNTQLATLDYGGSQIVFEVRGLFTDPDGALPKRGKNCIGNIFYGSDGYMVMDDDGFQVYKGENSEKVMDEAEDKSKSSTQGHMENFAAGVRSRNYKDLHADVEIGVLAADLCHLANIGYRTKRRLTWDGKSHRFAADPEANRLLTRDYRKPYAVPDKV